MDINAIQGVSESEIITQQNNVRANQSGFQNCLDQCIDQCMSKEKSTTSDINQLPEIYPVNFLNIKNGESTFANKASNLLDKFDDYVNSLKNPDMTLKSIEPAIVNLKNEADTLSKNFISSSENDSSLAKIVNDLQVMANVEYFKFYRGDYI